MNGADHMLCVALHSEARSRIRANETRAPNLFVEFPISTFSFHAILNFCFLALTRAHRAHWSTKLARV
jgi:hypothetical protein